MGKKKRRHKNLKNQNKRWHTTKIREKIEKTRVLHKGSYQ